MLEAVYPRVCGGTLEERLAELETHGLSPRVRGNLVVIKTSMRNQGSIPACAGEPV